MQAPLAFGILSFFFSLLIFQSAEAQTCQDIFLFSPIQYNVLRDDKLITDAEISDITGTITQAANLVKSELALPEQLTLRVRQKDNDPKARGTIILTPFQIGNKKLRHHSRSGIIHEFGHTLFDANIESVQNKLDEALSDLHAAKTREKLPNYDEIVDRIARLEKNLADGRRAQNLYYKKHGQLNGDLAEIITGIRDDLMYERMKIPKVLPDFNFRQFRVAYEEIFADVVAVSTLQRPSAMASLATPLVLKEKVHAQSRDFLAQPPAHWESSEVHELFWPARYSLSQHPQAVRLFRENPARLIRVVLDAIKLDLEDLSLNLVTIYSLTPSQRNARLIERMNELLDKEGPVSR